jgi:hypothetical protein
LNALRQRRPAIRLTVQSMLPKAVLRERISGDFVVIAGAADFGMLMVDALEAKVAESLAAYRAFHAEWGERLAWQERVLREAAPDGVLADIPYLTLAAAARLNLPALALCSLNWADILQGYCANEPDLAVLRAPILAAYNSAVAFLQPAPSMPMPELDNARPIGPIAALGRNRRAEIDRRLGLREGATLVLMGLGGVDMRPPLENWPEFPGVRWLTPPDWEVARADRVNWAALSDCSMLDLIRSCDVLFTKPGYGAFTEAACNGTRVLYVERDDWPEEPWLSDWLMAHGNGVKIGRRQLATGDVAEPLSALLDQPAKPPVAPTGAVEAAEWLERILGCDSAPDSGPVDPGAVAEPTAPISRR